MIEGNLAKMKKEVTRLEREIRERADYIVENFQSITEEEKDRKIQEIREFSEQIGKVTEVYSSRYKAITSAAPPSQELLDKFSEFLHL